MRYNAVMLRFVLVLMALITSIYANLVHASEDARAAFCGEIEQKDLSPQAKSAVDWLAREGLQSGTVDLDDLNVFADAGFSVQEEIELRKLILLRLYEFRDREGSEVYKRGFYSIVSFVLGVGSQKYLNDILRATKTHPYSPIGMGVKALILPLFYFNAAYQTLKAHGAYVDFETLDDLIKIEQGKIDYLQKTYDIKSEAYDC